MLKRVERNLHSFFISETLLGGISDKSISQTYEEINIQ